MFRRFASRAATALAVGAIVASGCVSSAPETVRIGISPWPGYELVHLAVDQGYFADEGLDVRLVEQLSTGDTRRSYERGQYDVWCGSNAELLFAREQSARVPRVVYVFDASHGADELLADVRVRSIADLRGRKVGLEPASLDVIAVHHALASVGMTLADVVVVGMPQSDVPRSLARGEVVAAQTYPPMSREVVSDGRRFRRLFDTSRAPGAIVDVLVMDSTFLARSPNASRRVLRALRRAERYLQEHTERAHVEIARREHLTDAQLHEAYEGIRMVPFEAQEAWLGEDGRVVRSLDAATRALVANGALRAVRETRSLVDAGPVRAAAREGP